MVSRRRSRSCFRAAIALSAFLIWNAVAAANLHAQTTVQGPAEQGPIEHGPAEHGPAEQGPAELDNPVKAETLPIAPMAIVALPTRTTEHKFWDNQNRALFVSVAALSAADFAVTRSNLQSGGQELNPVTRMFGRSTAGLAANFAGETIGSIGLSYFFHKTGHHRLERATSFVNIGGSAAAVAYGLRHR
jgi:hypothetical protein